MSTRRRADQSVQETMKAIYHEHYKDLEEAGVTITVMSAHSARVGEGEERKPALKHHGWPALAIVKITSHENRVAGLADALIIVDGDRWDELPEETQRALIDHELFHLVLVRDETGSIETDDGFRPKLRLRPHDHELGGFDEIAKRHGEAAPEVQALKAAGKAWQPKW